MVDYKKPENKEQFLCFRDEQISKMDILLKDWTENKYKNSVLLSYWLEDYEKFLRNEDTFKSKRKYFAYKRGQILFVNFGYRIGHELGGNHYCIAVSNNDSIRNGNLTVVPLRSFKGKFNDKFQVDLEDSLQASIYSKAVNRLLFITSEIMKNEFLLNEIELIYKAFLGNLEYSNFDYLEDTYKDDPSFLNNLFLIKEAYYSRNVDEFSKSYLIITKLIRSKNNKLQNINNSIELDISKILELNKRSIADINQITTISKSRILNPVRKDDALHNAILDSKYLNLINNKIKELFILDKK